jgi:hypothetical protein
MKKPSQAMRDKADKTMDAKLGIKENSPKDRKIDKLDGARPRKPKGGK